MFFKFKNNKKKAKKVKISKKTNCAKFPFE